MVGILESQLSFSGLQYMYQGGNWYHFELLQCIASRCEHVLIKQQLSMIASSPGHSQILSHSRGEKSGEGLGSKLRHGPEMVDSVSTN